MEEHCSTEQQRTAAAAGFLRLLGDPTRIRILGILQSGELNVTMLCKQLRLAQPTVSHHLGLLRNAKLVQTRRSGKQIFYSLNPEQVTAPSGVLRLQAGQIDIKLGASEPSPSEPSRLPNGC